MLTAEQSRYIVLKILIPTVIINFFLNAGIGYLTFHRVPIVPLWGNPGVGPDTLGTTFFLTLITFLILATIVRWDIASGNVNAWPRARQRLWLVTNWPTGNLAGAFLLGLAYLAVVGPLAIALLHFLGPPAYSFSGAVLVKAVYSALLSVLAVPVIVALALRQQRHGEISPTDE
ncbi:hypothetical protein [Desulfonatronum sp. SC1]|uniref:hypothetical protein n=1 Tax=Desulfonatronum sp. SC1 TaxID=2109626 RepID=UPI000D30B0CB|nr:hypothetical protein [Desulfonatronum sp. SC1]PTN37000.1 hypothetical protein C6366_07790 [Desulfonatronum sp. SC1]